MRTVGELLKKTREQKRFSLVDVSKLTRISIPYLKAIEESDYDILPAPVFTKGFIKNYAEVLGLNTKEVLAFFRREFDERKAKRKPTLNPPQPLHKSLRVLTSSSLIVGFIGILVLGFLGYLFSQYRSYSKLPDLTLSKPTDRLQQSLPYTEVAGKASTDAIVKINGQTIKTTASGDFAITVDLALGENKIEVTAINSLGRETNVTRTVYYLLSENNNEGTSPQVNGAEIKKYNIEVEIEVGPSAAWIRVEEDGKQTFEGILNPGVKRLFQAQEKINIRSGNGGSTKLKINGKDKGVMGQEGVPVEQEFRKENL